MIGYSAVYEGTKSFYKEEDETEPVNVYGKSKVEAEHYISENCKNFAILRSSIIYGPQTLSPVSKSLPIQVAPIFLVVLGFQFLGSIENMHFSLAVSFPCAG